MFAENEDDDGDDDDYDDEDDEDDDWSEEAVATTPARPSFLSKCGSPNSLPSPTITFGTAPQIPNPSPSQSCSEDIAAQQPALQERIRQILSPGKSSASDSPTGNMLVGDSGTICLGVELDPSANPNAQDNALTAAMPPPGLPEAHPEARRPRKK